MQRSLMACTTVFLTAVLALPVSGLAGRGTAAAAALPTVSVNDVSITEGTGGTKTLTFTVTQSARGKSRVAFTTKNDTASAPADYVAHTGSLRFAGKKLTRPVSVTIVGDALDEADETFFLELTGASGAAIADGEGVATILDDDPPPNVDIPATLSVPEGQTGDVTIASVDVGLSAPSGHDVTVDWATSDGTAMEAGNDYTGGSGAVLFPPGETHQSILIPVLGDVTTEADETFTVTISSPQHANLGNATDTVTIVDNDPLPTGVPIFNLTDVRRREGASGTRTLSFMVTRSDDTTSPVTVDYAVSNGAAVAPTDYSVVSATGTLSFGASEITKTVDVSLIGDRRLEHNETLFLTLNNASLGAIDDGQGTGTIVNDDTKTTVRVRVHALQHIIAVHGRVSPARRGKREIVRFFRRHNGAWVHIVTHRPTLQGKTDANGDGFTDSKYRTSFKRTRHGRCRVIASYPKDRRFSGSKAVKTFRC
jgi:Calx-beta domain